MYDWISELIGAPSQYANSYITQCAADIIRGGSIAFVILFAFAIINIIWGRGRIK